jgi:hypothetical protein
VLRQQWRGLRRGGKCRESGGSTNCDLEKFPPFHFSLSSSCARQQLT